MIKRLSISLNCHMCCGRTSLAVMSEEAFVLSPEGVDTDNLTCMTFSMTKAEILASIKVRSKDARVEESRKRCRRRLCPNSGCSRNTVEASLDASLDLLVRLELHKLAKLQHNHVQGVTRPLATAVRSVVDGVFLSKSKAAPGSARLTSAKIVSNETVDKARRNRGLMILASVRTPAPAATTAALAAWTSIVGHNLLAS